jgi:hypothetical protein
MRAQERGFGGIKQITDTQLHLCPFPALPDLLLTIQTISLSQTLSELSVPIFGPPL